MHQTQWSPERPLPPPVSLASQSHHEKPPEVTCTSRGNPGFPASTRERPRERSEEHTSELQSPKDLVCRLLLEKKKKMKGKRGLGKGKGWGVGHMGRYKV